MRKRLARLLHRLAERIDHTNHTEKIVVEDDYGICRCVIEIFADDLHGVEKTTEQLPTGWTLGDRNVRPNSH